MHYDRRTSEERRYWTSRLADRPPRTAPWPDFPSGAARRGAVSVLEFRFQPEVEGLLMAITGGNDFLGYAVLLAALQSCLFRLTGEPCVVVAAPARRPANSPNLLFLADTVRGDDSFRQRLGSARTLLLEGHDHQGYRFERLLGDLGVPADDGRSPLTGVLLRHDGVHLPPPELGFDLTLRFARDADHLEGSVGYDPGLYLRASVERLVARLERVVAAGLEAPDTPLHALPLVSPTEHRQLAKWSTPPVEPGTGWLHERIAHHAAVHGDVVAAAWDDQNITYRILDEQARCLAGELAERGVGPGAIVGVACDRGLERAVMPLAVLQAGAAFLPLDPEYPEERLAFMLADSGASALITTPALRGRFAPIAPLGCPVLELGAGRIAARHRHRPVAVAGDDLAYVIYTSGSSGRPKGVQLTHRGLANLARAQARAFGVEPGSRVLQLAAFGFDAAVSELAMALSVGARIDFGDAAPLIPSAALEGLLAARGISHLTITPSALREVPRVPLPDLATLIVAGEACGAELVAAWAPGRRLFNAYGPTETTVCATLGACTADEIVVTIGRPLAGYRLHVLDRRLSPMPPGTPGELCVGGVGLARGYRGRAGLTAERFVPDPAGSGDGARIYRSGDLGRFLPDGRVEFLGRCDRQVKLRGCRIEPGEIETALMALPEIHQAAVVFHRGPAGQDRLVAFVVPAAGAEISADRLRTALRERLPEFMVPAAFVVPETLPRTPSGKLDRAALAVSAASAGTTGTISGQPPRDLVELELVALWEELLERRPIGVRTSFFDLGGHSLLAMRLMIRIQEHFGTVLPPAALFESATIEELACLLRAKESRPWSPLVALETREKARDQAPPLFCVHPAGGTVLCYRDFAQDIGAGRPFYGLQARGIAAGQEPLTTMEAVAAYYVDALRERQPHGPYHLAGWSFGAVAAFEMACQLRAAGAEVALLALFDAYAPDLLADSLPERDDADVLSALLGGLLTVSAEDLRGLEPEERLSHLVERARRAELIPPDFDPEQARRLLHVAKTNYQVVEAYRPRAFDGRLILLRAEGERDFAARHTTDPTLGWGRWARGGVELHFVPGSHQTMMQPPHVERLAATLRSALELASAGIGRAFPHEEERTPVR